MNYQTIPDLLAIGTLVGVFQSLLRRGLQTQLRYWLVGWVLILIHFFAQLLNPNTGPWSTIASSISICTLFLAGVAFVSAAQAARLPLARNLQRALLAATPTIAFILCIIYGVQSRPLYYTLIVAGTVSTSVAYWIGLHFNSGRERYVYMAAILALYSIQATALHYDGPDCALSWILCSIYLAAGFFFWRSFPASRTGTLTTTGSFIAWALVFPAATLIDKFLPAWHIESEVWNLPKFLVASGMILTLLEEQMRTSEHLALHDELTGLPNRRLYEDRLGHALLRARRTGKHVALLILDLDRFKQVNDSLGHVTGDALLRGVAHRFLQCVRSADTLARIGGDEFAAILSDLPSREAAESVVSALHQTLADPIPAAGHSLLQTVSIGLSIFPYDGTTADSLHAFADHAMYREKKVTQEPVVHPHIGASAHNATA